MSIINDALKKIQKDQTPQPDVQPNAPAPDSWSSTQRSYQKTPVANPEPVVDTPASSTPKHSSPILPKLVMLLVILTALAIFLNWNTLKPLVRRISLAKPAPKVVKASSRPAPVSIVIDPNDPLSSIRVEGVMKAGDKKAALINGDIYEEGQKVRGFVIMKITSTGVTFDEKGTPREISIKK